LPTANSKLDSKRRLEARWFISVYWSNEVVTRLRPPRRLSSNGSVSTAYRLAHDDE
jgi:hypothetical protein